MKKTILKLEGVSKRFGVVQALSHINLEVRTGEVMALVGDNGAGKSTLIKGIAGIHPFSKGKIYYKGQPVKINRPRDSSALGIEVVYQDLALADNLDVVANMFLGREMVQTPWRIDEASMEKACLATLEALSVMTIHSVRQPVATLSGGQRQAIAVAKAVMWNSEVVILDEPTAALGVAQTHQVLELIKRLADKGLAIVLISHNLQNIFEVANRIVVLRLGQKVGEYIAAETSQQEVIQAITTGRIPRMTVQNGN
ncbi:ATP-binding cassette domain-containing protein [Anaerolineales bacterium HSG6]|nr:ATP-binding cassette domain-containing protein [Anaerolineales bacterium HSG6]MDM8531079.1 ATP-binding cassette domain-containing protein [Anaerolineales bacterium HSG25]